MKTDRSRLWQRAACALLIGICLSVLLWEPLSAAAAGSADGPDLERNGTLSIEFLNGDTQQPFSFGNKVGLFKVAEISMENGLHFVYDELFESVGQPPALASDMNVELADRLEEVAEFKGISLNVPSEVISENGKTAFRDLSPGLYLVVQTHRGTDSLKYKIRPFLVTIPIQKSDGTFEYDVEMTYLAREDYVWSADLSQRGASMVDTTSVEFIQEKKKTKWPVAIACVLIGMVLGLSISRRRRK